jgi:hypothetical protein
MDHKNETPLTILAQVIRILATLTDDIGMSCDEIDYILHGTSKESTDPDLLQAREILSGVNEILAMVNDMNASADKTARVCGDCGQGFRADIAYYCPTCSIRRHIA